MSSFFSKFADKAQSAINASPLAGKIPHTTPSQPRPDSPDASGQPPANQAAAQGGQKSHALEALSYQFRAFQQQYSSATSPAQKIITAEKGLILDFDNVAREAKTQSKELYTWGQTEPDDIKDVSDRIAYLNFVSGALAATFAQKLDASRAPFKALRDAETALHPRRNIRAALEAQLGKVENDPKKAGDLREQIKRAELEDAQAEREVLILKRKALKDSEQQKWTAVQEYAEKLLLLAQAAPPILAELPAYPPTPNSPYNGFQATGAVRAALQQALDHHKPGVTSFHLPSAGADLSRSDTRSFGESHASELSNINAPYPAPTPHPEIQVAQPQVVQQPVPTHAPAPALAPLFPIPTSQPHAPVAAHAPAPSQQSPPINPSSLNQMPAPIPASTIQTPPSASSPPDLTTSPTAPAVVITPTIAETGIPVAAGTDGPGPAKGSLHDLKHASTQSGILQSPPSAHPTAHYPSPSVVPIPAHAAAQYPSAEEEKKRLAAQYSTAHATEGSPLASQAPAAGPSTGQAKANESAEEEKKRLEREERERILMGDGHPPKRDGEPDEDLPPYQEPSFQ